MTPFQVNIFSNIEAPKVPNNMPSNSCSCCFILCYTVSRNLSINRPDDDFLMTVVIL